MKTRPFLPLALLLLLPAALPASLVNDRQAEVSARTSYVYRTLLDGRVKASAEFGVLTLTGSVDDPADRLLAEDTARHIPWVADVRNKITLLPSYREHSDPWIGLKVQARLRMREGIDADDTRVTVKDGLVTLSGPARDEHQKERTGLIAQEIAGTGLVRNNLVVTVPPPAEPAPAEPIDDPSVIAQVMAALRAHDAALATTTRVASTDGSVRISGEAASEAQRALITRLAGEVRGVRLVTNTMKRRD